MNVRVGMWESELGISTFPHAVSCASSESSHAIGQAGRPSIRALIRRETARRMRYAGGRAIFGTVVSPTPALTALTAVLEAGRSAYAARKVVENSVSSRHRA